LYNTLLINQYITYYISICNQNNANDISTYTHNVMNNVFKTCKRHINR